MSQNYSYGWSTKGQSVMPKSVSTFKNSVWALFGAHCDNGQNILKLHLLDHHVDYLERFRTVHVLSASPYEPYNFVMKKAYGSTSKRRQARKSDTVRNLDSALKRQRVSDGFNVQEHSDSDFSMQGLVQFGERICSQSLITLIDNLYALIFDSNRSLRVLYNSFESDAFLQHLFVSEQDH